MNNIFNINRFGLLLKRQWLDFGKVYIGTLIVLTGILIIGYWVFIPSLDKMTQINTKQIDLTFRYLLFIFLGFFFISIIAGNYFNNLGQKANSIFELMTPASTFEKFLTSVFYTSIIGVSSFLLVFYLVDLAFVSLLNSNLDSIRTAQEAVLNVRPIVMPAKDMFSEIFSDKMYLRNFSYNLISPFAVTSIFLLGSIYFKRFHYIKTATTLILFLVLWVSTSLYVMKLVTDDTVWIGNQYWQNENHVMQVFALIAFTVTIVFSVITYIRLKEKEV